jgi:hypothetical protein
VILNALRDDPHVIFRFLSGSALSQTIMGREFAEEIKEERSMDATNAAGGVHCFVRAAIT